MENNYTLRIFGQVKSMGATYLVVLMRTVGGEVSVLLFGAISSERVSEDVIAYLCNGEAKQFTGNADSIATVDDLEIVSSFHKRYDFLYILVGRRGKPSEPQFLFVYEDEEILENMMADVDGPSFGYGSIDKSVN